MPWRPPWTPWRKAICARSSWITSSGNPGKPTEDDLTADARLLLDWLAAQGVPPERTVIYGESLGTGIAVKMAA